MDDIFSRKILLVDDEADIVELMETVLKKEGFENIIDAKNGNDAIEKCKSYLPDLIVLDVMLPDMDGYEICKKIRGFSMVPIIFLSAKSEEIDKLLSFALGGDDYITKPFSPKEVVYRIKAILKREQYNKEKTKETGIIKIGDLKISENEGVVKKRDKVLQLTAMEFKLLIYLAKNKDIILSKTQIIENVWGSEFDGFDNTLMVHIRHLREKIEDDAGVPKYIRTIKKMGYKFVGNQGDGN